MNKHLGTILLLISFPAFGGMADWDTLPRNSPAIKMEANFDKSFWLVQGVQIDPDKWDGENIINISKNNGEPEIYQDHHHKFICMKNESTYLHVYDSGWGPGYSLTKKPFVDPKNCTDITQQITLGSGIHLGMSKVEIENLLEKNLPDTVADLRFEEIVPSESCKGGIWHVVDLKVVFENKHISAIYFDDHGEPYDSCE